MSQAVNNKGWTVTLAGMGINLALGILYTWSIFSGAIKQSIEKGGEGAFNWNLASLNDPYAVCCLMFAFSMMPAGKCQDKFGPKVTAFIGAVLVGVGLLWISQTADYLSWVIGFGVLTGSGIGFGYSAATPPALKWFPAEKTGLIAGLVVGGFGLASVYIAPLSSYLVGVWGLQKAMMFFGAAFFIVVGSLSMLLMNPPKGYVPGGAAAKTAAKAASQSDALPSEVIRTPVFWKLWFIFFIGAGVGLMVIGSVAGMAKKSMGEAAFIAVAIMAIGNAGGRVVAGIVSDKIGRNATLATMLALQAILMLIAIPTVGSQGTGPLMIVLLATFIGFNYGTNLSLFPSYAKTWWGLKSFGVNYGILFTSWGLGGFILSRTSQMLYTQTGSFTYSFVLAAVLLAIGAGLTLTLKAPEPATVPEGARFEPQLGLAMADGGEKIDKKKKK